MLISKINIISEDFKPLTTLYKIQKDILVEANTTKYKTNTLIGKMFKKTREEIIKTWQELIKLLENLFDKINQFIKKKMKKVSNRFKFKKTRVSFSGKPNTSLISFKPYYINNLEELYYEFKQSLHFIVLRTEKAYRMQLKQLDHFYDTIIQSSLYKKVVNESNFEYYDFNMKDLPFLDSENQEDSNLFGYELFDHLAGENIMVFNDTNIDELSEEQEFQFKVYDSFQKAIITNITKIVSNKYYQETNAKLTSKFVVRNELLNIFLESYKEYTNNDDIREDINLYTHILIDPKNPTKEDIDQLRIILGLVLLKTKVTAKAIHNMANLDSTILIKTEYDALDTVDNVSIEELRKIKSIIQNKDSNIIKNGGNYFDFSSYNLGSVILSDEAKADVYDKYIDTEYCTTLLYFASNYEYTLIAHGMVEYFGSLYKFIDGYKKEHLDEFNLFKECYNKEISIISNIMNKDFNSFDISDCNYIDNLLDSSKFLNSLDMKTMIALRDFRYSYMKRWISDKVYIPFINNKIDDVEMMIYLLNLNKVNTAAFLICNHHYIPNPRTISYYNNSVYWISTRKLVE